MDVVIKQITTAEDEKNEHREIKQMMMEDKRDKLIRRREREAREAQQKNEMEAELEEAKVSNKVKVRVKKVKTAVAKTVKPLVPTKAGMAEKLKEMGYDPGKKKRELQFESAWMIQGWYRQCLSRQVLEVRKMERQARLEDAAATVIQQLAIFRETIKLAKSLVPTTFDKQYSKWRKVYYYRNLKTGEQDLHKPRFLGKNEDLELPEDLYLKERRRRRALNPITIELAAMMVQSVFRRRQCIKAVRAKIHRQHQKLLDAKTGKYYYVNKRDLSVTWYKPELLADGDDIKTEELKQEEAATVIQHLFIMCRERTKRKDAHLRFFRGLLQLGIFPEIKNSVDQLIINS
jgi:hypothetical protein